MKVRWLWAAAQEFESPQDFLAVHRRLALDGHLPSAFSAHTRPGPVPGTRELVLPGLPFLVVYRIRDNAVEVLRTFATGGQVKAGDSTSSPALLWDEA